MFMKDIPEKLPNLYLLALKHFALSFYLFLILDLAIVGRLYVIQLTLKGYVFHCPHYQNEESYTLVHNCTMQQLELRTCNLLNELLLIHNFILGNIKRIVGYSL